MECQICGDIYCDGYCGEREEDAGHQDGLDALEDMQDEGQASAPPVSGGDHDATAPVTITHTAHAMYAPSFTGAPVWQPARTIITTHIAGEYVEITDTRVTSYVHNLMGNLIALDMTELTPADLTTHGEVAGYWYAVARGWADAATAQEAA